MYVGRFVVVGPEVGAYRVSSRSFPNRKAIEREDCVTVTPTADAPESDNPYIAYNCVRTVERPARVEGGETTETAVLGNGSHVDPIAEKLELGYPARDALAESLLALDYEKDDYDTPRIAGTIGEDASVGIVRRDALLVREVSEPTLVATYEKDAPEAFAFEATSAADAASEVYDHEFEHAVCAVGVARREGDAGFDLALENGN